MLVDQTGEWAQVRKALAATGRLDRAIERAVAQEAQALRTMVVQGLTAQAPGDQPLQRLTKLTLARRQLQRFFGSKALIVRGDLRNSVTVAVRHHEAFVGVLRRARSKTGGSLADVGAVQEFGTAPVIVPLTPAMRRFLGVLLRKAGVSRPRKTGGKKYAVLHIPARPFLRPSREKFMRGAVERFTRRLRDALATKESL